MSCLKVMDLLKKIDTGLQLQNLATWLPYRKHQKINICVVLNFFNTGPFFIEDIDVFDAIIISKKYKCKSSGISYKFT